MGPSGDGAIFSGNQCLGETGQVSLRQALAWDCFQCRHWITQSQKDDQVVGTVVALGSLSELKHAVVDDVAKAVGDGAQQGGS